MRARPEFFTWQEGQPLADLADRTAELGRQLDDMRMSIQAGLAQAGRGHGTAKCQIHDLCTCGAADVDVEPGPDVAPGTLAAPRALYSYDGTDSEGPDDRPEWRTEVLVNHGRHSSYRLRLSRARKITIAGSAALVLGAVLALVMALAPVSASWPPSVAAMQAETARACENPDVKSEPGQVNFACATNTRQILWVFALLTSGGNAGFADIRTGRQGLEPITPAQGDEVAWSLNLHHPYDPANPIDSLEVAARAINNIVGGATVISANGRPVIEPGLESDRANCVRYTGSAALTARTGFPSLCTRPVTSQAGQAALVADIYQKWMLGAPPQAAQNAAVLFENANNPGDPRVQAILQHLLSARPAA